MTERLRRLEVREILMIVSQIASFDSIYIRDEAGNDVNASLGVRAHLLLDCRAFAGVAVA